jgi:uncharacterized protein DUF488
LARLPQRDPDPPDRAAGLTAGRSIGIDRDDRRGEGKRSRTVLAPIYARLYTEEILDHVDLEPIVKWIGDSSPALLCVERDPEACHRSLIAARLRSEWDFSVEHLRPTTGR